MRSQRRKTFIDKSVQGKLVMRVVLYWLLSMVGVFGVLAGTPILMSWFVPSAVTPTSGQILVQTWRTFWPCLFASGLVLPILVLDVIRISHRFAGPVFRLRTSMRDLADGQPVTPIKFREGDFWCEMAEEFNRVAARVRHLQPTNKPEKTADSSAGSVAV